jgi:hypothetical protein
VRLQVRLDDDHERIVEAERTESHAVVPPHASSGVDVHKAAPSRESPVGAILAGRQSAVGSSAVEAPTRGPHAFALAADPPAIQEHGGERRLGRREATTAWRAWLHTADESTPLLYSGVKTGASGKTHRSGVRGSNRLGSIADAGAVSGRR